MTTPSRTPEEPRRSGRGGKGVAPQGPQRSHPGAWKPRPSGRGGRPRVPPWLGQIRVPDLSEPPQNCQEGSHFLYGGSRSRRTNNSDPPFYSQAVGKNEGLRTHIRRTKTPDFVHVYCGISPMNRVFFPTSTVSLIYATQARRVFQ